MFASASSAIDKVLSRTLAEERDRSLPGNESCAPQAETPSSASCKWRVSIIALSAIIGLYDVNTSVSFAPRVAIQTLPLKCSFISVVISRVVPCNKDYRFRRTFSIVVLSIVQNPNRSLSSYATPQRQLVASPGSSPRENLGDALGQRLLINSTTIVSGPSSRILR